MDADGKVVLGFFFLHLVKETLDHGGRELFAGETVAPADDLDIPAGFGDSGDAVLVERLSDGAGLFGPIQSGNDPNRLG